MQVANIGRDPSVSPDFQIPVADGCEINRWPMQNKMLVGAGVVMLIALATMAASRAYTHYQNGCIESIQCDRGFSYYNNASDKYGASASDQYCLGEMFEKGDGTQQSFGEARTWYHKAYDQGLTFARDALCDRSIFPVGLQENFENLRPICCPSPCPSSILNGWTPPDSCLPASCPWEPLLPWESQ